jgi:hypothetical protein
MKPWVDPVCRFSSQCPRNRIPTKSTTTNPHPRKIAPMIQM